MLTELKNKVLVGYDISIDEAVKLSEYHDIEELCAAANDIREKMCGNTVDTCSIINARSGRCSEDCKWCAQSHKFHTGINEYDYVSEKDTLEMAEHNNKRGVKRFSLVTSGRKVSKRDLKVFCDYYSKIKESTDLYLCASMGLLNEEELIMLKEAGVKRYHCNLETSASNFHNLCTTHTPDDKKRTIKLAQKVGMEVCSGGIIGMGETMRQRIELAFELKELNINSVPLNILNPIKGTALENQALISDDEIRRTVAVIRFILPKVIIRFAGGRMRLSHDVQAKIFNGGLNGALIGDMLTTVGNRIDEDYQLFDELNLKH